MEDVDKSPLWLSYQDGRFLELNWLLQQYLIGFLEGLPSQQTSLAKGVNGHSPHHAAQDQRVKLDELKLLLTEAKEGLVRCS